MLLTISKVVGRSLKIAGEGENLKYEPLLPSTVHEQRRCSEVIIVESSPLCATSYETQSKLFVILRHRALTTDQRFLINTVALLYC